MKERRLFRKLFIKLAGLYLKAFRTDKPDKIKKIFLQAQKLRIEIITYRVIGVLTGHEYAMLYYMVYHLIHSTNDILEKEKNK